MEVKNLKQIPADLMKLMIADMQSWEPTFTAFDDLEEVIEYIRESGYSKKSMDSDYVNYDYSTEVGDWILEAYGSCYIKDSCICDEQMAESITITSKVDIANEKQAKEREKALAKVFAKETSDAKWVETFNKIISSNGKIEDVLSELKKWEFPTKVL